MLNEKFNPDVLDNFNNVTKLNENQKFNLNNNPYNLIISDDNKLSENNKFNINLDNDKKINIVENYDNILNERNIEPVKKLSKKNLNEIKKKFSLKNTQLLNIEDNLSEDFIDIKTKFISDYAKEEEDIKSSVSKYNNILDSLLEEGILD